MFSRCIKDVWGRLAGKQNDFFSHLLPEQPIHVRNPGGPHNFQLLDTALGEFYEGY